MGRRRPLVRSEHLNRTQSRSNVSGIDPVETQTRDVLPENERHLLLPVSDGRRIPRHLQHTAEEIKKELKSGGHSPDGPLDALCSLPHRGSVTIAVKDSVQLP